MNFKTTTTLFIFALAAQCAYAQTERLINTRDSYPDMSPNGETLVFQSNRAGSNQVWSMDMETGRLNQLTDLAMGAETPVFSPDGRRIVFAAYVGENNNDVFIMDADGENLKRLTNGPGYDGHPHWSFDGLRIVFNSDRVTPDRNAAWSDRWHEIFSMDANGGDIRQHTRCKAVCTYGSLSPDGTKILYRKVVKGPGLDWSLGAITRNSEVYTADLDGANEVNLSNNAAFDGWPLWSPDGKTIVFASNRSGPALTGQVWVMDADGSHAQQLSTGPWSHVQPSWSSNGHWIHAYQSRETPDYEFCSVVRIAVK